jgi:hypothetical protein
LFHPTLGARHSGYRYALLSYQAVPYQNGIHRCQARRLSPKLGENSRSKQMRRDNGLPLLSLVISHQLTISLTFDLARSLPTSEENSFCVRNRASNASSRDHLVVEGLTPISQCQSYNCATGVIRGQSQRVNPVYPSLCETIASCKCSNWEYGKCERGICCMISW